MSTRVLIKLIMDIDVFRYKRLILLESPESGLGDVNPREPLASSSALVNFDM